MIKFNKNEVDLTKVEERAMNEAINVMSGPKAGNRDSDTIMRNCMTGHIAEQWLIDNMDMKDFDEQYHDLIDEDGKIVEVKASVSLKKLQEQYDRIKDATWNHSDRMIGFLVTGDTYEMVIDIEL